ncbi:dTDP-4-amino-4,6-dideoxygalactose transaminase, partial [Candidatus Pelagibacter ubique]|nr:dTDP-4-amino-4,6-dideoxygalactose transaminase [Candidatus Pelagibacter ubique]
MIEFNKPFVTSKLPNIKNLDHYSSGGPYTKKCQQWLIKEIKCKDALLVHSCTGALEMCALLLNIKNGDEIIMPSYTFVSTANAFVLRGGKPVFVDIDPETCNIDLSKIEQAISKKTRAIVVVHYAGVSCDMDLILKIAKRNKLYVIEDAAQAILSKYKGKPLGSLGDLATLSFHETKNIHCGQGGALLINNPKFIRRAKIIRDKGTNKDLFNQNMVKKYTWVDYGSSYGLDEINAAFLYSQFKQAKKITKKRINIFNKYHKQLKSLEIKKLIKRPSIPKYAKHNGHIYYLIVKNNQRNKLIKHLRQKKINSVFHYIPLHSSKFGKIKTKTQMIMKNTNY